MRGGLIFAASLWALALPLAARAHTAGESVFSLDVGGDRGRFELALRDLDDALALDRDGDGRLTRGELTAGEAAVARFVEDRVVLATATPCAPRVTAVGTGTRGGAATAVLDLALGCPPGDALVFESRLFFERDGLHRAFVTVGDRTELLRAERRRVSFSLHRPAAGATFVSFLADGIVHIWQGLDHLLFLVVLLLPAVLRRQGGRWVPAPALGGALLEVVRVVSAFTVAHSLTLGLAALGVLRASPAIIEPAIAASVVLAAVNNLVPAVGADGRDRWVIAFALGLLHGFGFSSVLAEIGLPRGHLLAALLGFNLGVECGQLLLVVLVVPLAFLARGTSSYRRLALRAGSALVAGLALFWLVERVAS